MRGDDGLNDADRDEGHDQEGEETGNSARTQGRDHFFRQTRKPKTVKNRLHLDLRVGEENVDAQVVMLTERGATYLHKSSQGPHSWVTMADPGGQRVLRVLTRILAMGLAGPRRRRPPAGQEGAESRP